MYINVSHCINDYGQVNAQHIYLTSVYITAEQQQLVICMCVHVRHGQSRFALYKHSWKCSVVEYLQKSRELLCLYHKILRGKPNFQIKFKCIVWRAIMHGLHVAIPSLLVMTESTS